MATKTCPYLNLPCIQGECMMWVKKRLAEDGVTVLEPGYCIIART